MKDLLKLSMLRIWPITPSRHVCRMSLSLGRALSHSSPCLARRVSSSASSKNVLHVNTKLWKTRRLHTRRSNNKKKVYYFIFLSFFFFVIKTSYTLFHLFSLVLWDGFPSSLYLLIQFYLNYQLNLVVSKVVMKLL
jgi:Co/Zn/Cd efflux system component